MEIVILIAVMFLYFHSKQVMDLNNQITCLAKENKKQEKTIEDLQSLLTVAVSSMHKNKPTIISFDEKETTDGSYAPELLKKATRSDPPMF